MSSALARLTTGGLWNESDLGRMALHSYLLANDPVRIWRGRLAGRLGLYAGMRGGERVEVLLELLGRVTLPRDDIEPVP
jgi:hypothetical protein